jgi:hypothetical protein
VANTPFFSTATVVAGMSAVVALLNGGFLEIYAGTQPTDANTALTGQTLLSGGMTFATSPSAFGTPVATGAAGSRVVTATANPIVADTSAAATGTAAWFRAYKADGLTGVMDGSVGTSGCDLNLNTTAIVQYATVSVTSLTITQAE